MDKTTKNLLSVIIGVGATIASAVIIKKSLESMELSDKEVIRYKNKQVRNNAPIKDIKPQAEIVAKVGSKHEPYDCDKDIDDIISIRRNDVVKLQELVDEYNDMLETTIATKSNTRDGLIPLRTAYKLITDMIDDMESQIHQSLLQAVSDSDDDYGEDYDDDDDFDEDDNEEFEFNWSPRIIGQHDYNDDDSEEETNQQPSEPNNSGEKEFAFNKLYEDSEEDSVDDTTVNTVYHFDQSTLEDSLVISESFAKRLSEPYMTSDYDEMHITSVLKQVQEQLSEMKSLEEQEKLLFETIGMFNEEQGKDMYTFYKALSTDEKNKFMKDCIENGICININYHSISGRKQNVEDENESESLILDDTSDSNDYYLNQTSVESLEDAATTTTSLLADRIERTTTADDEEAEEDTIDAYSAYHVVYVFPHELAKRKSVKIFRKMEEVGEYSVLVDWGDGDKRIMKSSDISTITHNYADKNRKYPIKLVVTNTEHSAEIFDIFEEWVHKVNTIKLSKEATDKIFNK